MQSQNQLRALKLIVHFKSSGKDAIDIAISVDMFGYQCGCAVCGEPGVL